MSTRKNDLAAIHIRKGELGLGDDEYRDLLFSIARVRSAGDLDFAGRRQVLDHFAKIAQARGITLKPTPRRTGVPRRSEVEGDRAELMAKINAQLLDLGLARNYLEHAQPGRPSMIRRIAGVDALDFATPAGLTKLIVALKMHQQRKQEA